MNDRRKEPRKEVRRKGMKEGRKERRGGKGMEGSKGMTEREG